EPDDQRDPRTDDEEGHDRPPPVVRTEPEVGEAWRLERLARRMDHPDGGARDEHRPEDRDQEEQDQDDQTDHPHRTLTVGIPEGLQAPAASRPDDLPGARDLGQWPRRDRRRGDWFGGGHQASFTRGSRWLYRMSAARLKTITVAEMS